ncbi:MAG: hypothetical protein J1F69_00430 [Clostridiales bacterium]|nr:hypothetical protein [Clostridiales bacterium]
MKKTLVAFLLAALMCFALVGCGGNDNPKGNKTPTPDAGNGENAYKVTFACDQNVSVLVYNTQDMSGAGSQSTTAYSRDGVSGDLLKDGNGQVNFKLVFASGYELADIVITEGYNNLKNSADTGVENGYRITKITADLTVTITSKQVGAAEDLTQGYTVTFVCDEHVSVLVYKTQDMSGNGEQTNTAYSRDSSTGALTKGGDGQVNFVLVFDNGYELADIDITEGYNNLKGSNDTGVENGYRITKITDNLTVTVTTKEEGAAEDFTQGYKVTFVCDEHVSVLVYKTQDMSGDGEQTNTAYSRESGTGALTKVDGQVNFVLIFDEGYGPENYNIEITGTYKNNKEQGEINGGYGYRITKIESELTITITAKQA